MFALGVQQVVGDGDGGLDQNFLAALAYAFLFQFAQDGERLVVVGAHDAGAVAGGAGCGCGFDHAGTQTLARHFHQAEARYLADLNAGAVVFQLVLDAALDGGVVAPLFHVDEIDDDQTGQIAQAQLAGDLFGGLEVGAQRRVLDRAFLGRLAGVDVDGDQRLGDADHDVAAGFQLYRRVEHARQIAFDLIAREQRHRIGVELDLFGAVRNQHGHIVQRDLVAVLALDQNLVDVAVVEVADRAFYQVAFGVYLGRCDGFQRQVADLFPLALKVFIVALDIGFVALGARCADDQSGALRHFDLVCDGLEFLAIRGVGDLAGNPATARGVGHQNAITSGERQIGGQRRAFVAALFLDDLHQHDLADLDDFLDLVAAGARFAWAHLVLDIVVGDGFDVGILGGGRRFLAVAITVFVLRFVMFAGAIALIRLIGLRIFVIGVFVGRGIFRHFDQFGIRLLDIDYVIGRDLRVFRSTFFGGLGFGRTPAAARFRFLFVFVVGHGLRISGLFGQQFFTVRGRDLVIVGVNFRKRQKSVPVAAIVDKGRLQRRFDPDDFGQIDISGELTFVEVFVIEFLDLVSINHYNAGFLRVGGIDKHFLWHINSSPHRRRAPGGAESLELV